MSVHHCSAPVLPRRPLIVTADDFGIGPGVSRGILELAAQRRVTATVLLVNSPHARAAVQMWRRAGQPAELGWHPCLTLDAPLLPARRVPSLVDGQGRFCSLPVFLRRLLLGQVRRSEAAAELRQQWQQYIDWVGHPPSVVNGHHHVHVLPMVRDVLTELLAEQSPPPYLRRVREPLTMIASVSGSRGKRLFLNRLGQRAASRGGQHQRFPGNDWLLGLTGSRTLADLRLFERWLRSLPEQTVELMCHPGQVDPALLGRDAADEQGLQERALEMAYLSHPDFVSVCRQAQFTLTAPEAVRSAGSERKANVA